MSKPKVFTEEKKELTQAEKEAELVNEQMSSLKR
jgi:hypothetical protein